MANIKFTNFARSKLTVGISTGATTITITGASGALFPALTAGEYFYATIENAALVREIVKVTARTVDTLTVARAQDGTTAAAWNAGDTFALRFNAAAITDVMAAAAAGTYPEDLIFTGTGNRITGDFSNTTVANRVSFQSSTLNGYTQVGVIPNGTSPTAGAVFLNSSGATNASYTYVGVNGTLSTLEAGIVGTGTYLPMAFHTNGSERFRINTTGAWGIGGANYGTAGQVLKSNGDAPPTWGSGDTRYSTGTGFSANTTLSSADYNKHFYVSGTMTLTLPVADVANIGKVITLYCHTAGTITIATQGSQILYANGISTTTSLIAMGLGDSLTLINYSGAGWMTHSGPSGLGYGQTWQNVTGSRTSGTTYYNTTGKPIEVGVNGGCATSGSYGAVVNGISVVGGTASTAEQRGITFVVPIGASYVVTYSAAISTWAELR
jgi:hypothetical protein